jgi:MFS family permease
MSSVDPLIGESRARLIAVLCGCFVCQMGLGSGYVFGATLKYIVSEFEWSRAAFAAASAPLLVSMGLAAPLVGNLTERLGARRVLCVATALLGLSLWLFSRMESLREFYLASALFGVALTGLGDIVVGSVAARWVAGRRGLALRFVYVGSNVGGAAVPLVAESIAARFSWREAVAAVGVAAVVLILPVALGVVREPRAGTGFPRATEPKGGENDLELSRALRTRTFWVLAAVLFAFYFYYLAITQHLIAYLSDIGFSNAEAAASLSFAVGLGIFGKLAIGLLADRVDVKNALLFNFALLALGSFALLGAGRPGMLPVFLLAHGFATAAENVLLPLTVAECFGVQHLARIYGALMMTLFPGGVLGPIFAGAIFDAFGSYGPAFTSFAVLNGMGVLALFAVRRETAPDPRAGEARSAIALE